jgi:hypothetical protein
MGDVWLCWRMDTAKQCGVGRHALATTILERHPQLDVPMALTDVELVVRYDSGAAGGATRCRM